VRCAVALANRDPRQRIAAADLRAAGIDPERLRAWFKRHFGTTFARAIRAGRLASALGAIDAGDDALGAAFEHGWSSASAFRDATGLGRKRAIQILEFFDRTGYTRRVRDVHLLRPDVHWNSTPR
jgi:methylphosphotriester-DNA--protein-cysteine methyltransferase